jgi:hypothetical protein
MRTTLSLEEDVAAKLKAEMRRSGKSLKQTVNELLRLGLNPRPARTRSKPFKVKARDLGRLRAGLSLDNVGELLELVDGPAQR